MRVELPPILRAFQAAADPVLAPWLELEPRSCIAATRVAIECLQRFGYPARPQAVKFVVEVPAREAVYVSGFSGEERAAMEKNAATWQDLRSQTGHGWNGHLIAVAGDEEWIIDASFSQAANALATIGCVLGAGANPTFLFPLIGHFGEDFVLAVHGLTETDEEVRIRYFHNADDSYLLADAWGTDHIERIIDAIERRMSVELSS